MDNHQYPVDNIWITANILWIRVVSGLEKGLRRIRKNGECYLALSNVDKHYLTLSNIDKRYLTLSNIDKRYLTLTSVN